MRILQILGPAAVPTLILIAVGLGMLLIEMFTPGVGVPGATGLLCLIAVVIIQVGWGSPEVALYIVAIVLLIIVLALILFIRSFQKGRLSRSFLVLNENIESNASPVAGSEDAALAGKSGVSATPLRPAGIVEIGGRRIDAMTDGAFIEAGKAVAVVRVEGLRIVVAEREADGPEEA